MVAEVSLQSVASATEEMASSVNEIGRQVQESVYTDRLIAALSSAG